MELRSPTKIDALVEIRTWDKIAIHQYVAAKVDRILRGQPVNPGIRSLDKPDDRDGSLGNITDFPNAKRTQFVSGTSRKKVINQVETERFPEWAANHN